MVHFFVTSFTQMGLLLVLICWTSSSTGATFSLEEEFRQLKENYIQMKEVVKILESKVSQLKSLESKVIQLESKDVEMQEKLTELEAKVHHQDSLLTSLLREKNEHTAATGFDSLPVSNNQPAAPINELPSSCGDLKIIGHIWNGIYSVMGSSVMESVYCDFTKLPADEGFQKWIGYVDVKSAPVYFYAQRNTTYNNNDTPLPFNLARVNEGNAMNLTSGIFTAPQPGIYFFSFTGVGFISTASNNFYSYLYLNGNIIVTNYVVGEPGSQYSPFTLQSTLKLEKDDRVWVQMKFSEYSSFLADADSLKSTHFTGFMLEEEIVASL